MNIFNTSWASNFNIANSDWTGNFDRAVFQAHRRRWRRLPGFYLDLRVYIVRTDWLRGPFA